MNGDSRSSLQAASPASPELVGVAFYTTRDSPGSEIGWAGYLPLGALSVVLGPNASGKSTLLRVLDSGTLAAPRFDPGRWSRNPKPADHAELIVQHILRIPRELADELLRKWLDSSEADQNRARLSLNEATVSDALKALTSVLRSPSMPLSARTNMLEAAVASGLLLVERDAGAVCLPAARELEPPLRDLMVRALELTAWPEDIDAIFAQSSERPLLPPTGIEGEVPTTSFRAPWPSRAALSSSRRASSRRSRTGEE